MIPLKTSSSCKWPAERFKFEGEGDSVGFQKQT